MAYPTRAASLLVMILTAPPHSGHISVLCESIHECHEAQGEGKVGG